MVLRLMFQALPLPWALGPQQLQPWTLSISNLRCRECTEFHYFSLSTRQHPIFFPFPPWAIFPKHKFYHFAPPLNTFRGLLFTFKMANSHCGALCDSAPTCRPNLNFSFLLHTLAMLSFLSIRLAKRISILGNLFLLSPLPGIHISRTL